MVGLDNGIYTCFGLDSLGHSMNDLWTFDQVAASWNALPGLPDVGRRGGVCASTGTAMYYVTGIDEGNTRLKDVWMYSPFLGNAPLSIDVIPTLLGTYDLMGNETQEIPNKVMIQRYSDGSVKKILRVE